MLLQQHFDKIAWLLRHPAFRARPLATVANMATWQYGKLSRRSVKIKLNDLSIEARHSDGVARLVTYFQEDADEMFAFMQMFLRPGDRFIDVGANIGTHSLLGSRLVGPSGSVESIEADPLTCQVLRRNIDANAMSNITVHNVCMSNTSGVAKFNINRNSAKNSLFVAGEREILLDARRLDETCVGGGIVLLKIDVEGADYLVLEGATELFRTSPPMAVIIERSRDTDRIDAFLLANGYRLMDFDRASRRLVPMHDKTENIYAIHPSGMSRISAMEPVVH